MSGIATTLSIIDRMTAPIMSIDNAINSLVNGFNSVESAADIDTSTFDNIKRQVEMTSFAAEQLRQQMEMEASIRQNEAAQRGFNDQIQQGSGLADTLGGKIGKIAGMFGIAFGAKAAITWIEDSIAMTNEQIRAEQQLSNVLANQGASQEDYNAMLREATAIQSAGMYDKTSMIGGAAELSTYISDVEALQSLMGTLSNYAAGMSGGAEVSYTQMIDYATQLGKALEGQYDGLAKKGFKLTDAQKDVINFGNEIERALVVDEIINQSWANLYEQMSNTPTGQLAQITNAVNDIRASFGAQLLPVIMTLFTTIRENLPQIEQMMMAFVPAIQTIIGYIGQIIQVAFGVYRFFADNWSLIAPIILGIAAAFIAWKVATTLVAVAQGLLNAAILANPLTWIIVAIAAIIGVITVWINRVGGVRVAWLIVVNAVLTAWDWLKIGFFTGVYWVLDLWDKMSFGMMAAGAAIANFMGDMKANVLMILQNMVNGAIGIINGFINILNKIPGVNIGLIEQVSFGTQAQLANEAEKQAREAGLMNAWEEINAAIVGRADALNTMRDDARAATADRIAEIEDARAAANQEDNTNVVTPSDFVFTDFDGMGSGIGDIADNTAAIAGNTKNMVDISEENMKLWRDLAERDTINRFTTAEVKVDFGGITNNVSSDMDLDGIVEYISVHVEERLLEVAEGVNL